MADSTNESSAANTAKPENDLSLQASAGGTSGAVTSPKPGQGGHSTADDVVETPIKGGG
jgi:hypothetical protein